MFVTTNTRAYIIASSPADLGAHQLGREQTRKPRVGHRVATPQSLRLLRQLKEPLHPDPLHPFGRPHVTPATTSIEPPTPRFNGAPSVRPYSASQYSFRGDDIATITMSGAATADLCGKRGLIGLGEIAVMPSAEVQSRVALPELIHGVLEDTFTRPEDVDPIAPALGECEHFEHQLDSGDALRDRDTQEPRRPHHRLPIGVDQLALLDNPLEALCRAEVPQAWMR